MNDVSPLTADELVGLRGLLQERYEDGPPKWLTELIDATVAWVSDAQGVSRDEVRDAINRDHSPCDHRYCEKQGYGLCFGVRAAMIDFHEASAPDSAASPAADSDIPPSPAAGRSICEHDLASSIAVSIQAHDSADAGEFGRNLATSLLNSFSITRK